MAEMFGKIGGVESDIDKELKSIIQKHAARVKVIGCGGGGGNSVSRMKEIGIKLSETSESIDLKKHRDLIQNADLILTLTEKHKEDIMKFEEVNNKPVLTIKEFAGQSGDIEDPSMKGIEGFRLIRDEIKEYIMKGLQKSLCKN